MTGMDKHIKLIKALSDGTRLRIARLLAQSKTELCICEIMDSLGLAQYNISKHIRELRNAGLVKERKQGKFVMYRLTGAPTAFQRSALAMAMAMPPENFAKDNARLKERLSLRSGGRCVVGMRKKSK